MSKVFEDEFIDCHASMISLCKEFINQPVDKIYVYCCMERCEKMFDVFFTRNGMVLTAREMKIPTDIQSQFLQYGLDDIARIEEVCKQYSRPAPTEIKMVYDMHTRSLDTNYLYKEYLDAQNTCAEEVYDRWISEIDPTYPTDSGI